MKLFIQGYGVSEWVTKMDYWQRWNQNLGFLISERRHSPVYYVSHAQINRSQQQNSYALKNPVNYTYLMMYLLNTTTSKGHEKVITYHSWSNGHFLYFIRSWGICSVKSGKLNTHAESYLKLALCVWDVPRKDIIAQKCVFRRDTKFGLRP